MQIDMHYYATACMARAAGFDAMDAGIVAWAAQHVDEHGEELKVRMFSEDADYESDMPAVNVRSTATAHHVLDVKNILGDDENRVWVPFHFLPGGQGPTREHRLVCQIDSDIARDVLRTAVSRHRWLNKSKAAHVSMRSIPIDMDRLISLMRIGTAVHAYMDTFAHYGFSGVRSDLNEISDLRKLNDARSDDEQLAKFQRRYGDEMGRAKSEDDRSFLRKLWTAAKSGGAENLTRALGHGAALTHPDQPYLEWEFTREATGKVERRNNLETFGRACAAVARELRMSFNFNKRDDDFLPEKPDVLRDILARRVDKHRRSAIWQEYHKARFGAELEDYEEVNRRCQGYKESPTLMAAFCVAAEAHRAYVMHDLLPKHGIYAT